MTLAKWASLLGEKTAAFQVLFARLFFSFFIFYFINFVVMEIIFLKKKTHRTIEALTVVIIVHGLDPAVPCLYWEPATVAFRRKHFVPIYLKLNYLSNGMKKKTIATS